MKNAEMDIVLFGRSDIITTSTEEECEESGAFCEPGTVGM